MKKKKRNKKELDKTSGGSAETFPTQLNREDYFKCPIWFADAPQFVEDLNKDGIEFELSATGSTIFVPDNQVNTLRLRFNRVEYGDAIDGFNVFDNSNCFFY